MARLLANFDLCTGCKICELACSAKKFGGYNPNKALLTLHEDLTGLATQPNVCAQCDNPFCQKVCPTNAIIRNEDTGALFIDANLCIDCGLCAQNCPIGMIKVVNNTHVKCDLCDGEPACVKSCPTTAIRMIEWTKPDRRGADR